MRPTPAIGIFLPTLTAPGDHPIDPVAAARHADALGFESVWVVDQLIAGTGVAILDATTVLAAVAGATSRVRLGFGVAIAPIHPVTWLAKQAATLQHLSGDRVLLGVGIGGDRHLRSWSASGVPRRERGPRTDAALEVIADLIAGRPVDARRVAAATPGTAALTVDDDLPVQLAPGATVPPIVIGGMSDAAIRRVAAHADDWFLLPVPPTAAAAAIERLDGAVGALGRPRPSITASVMTMLDGDPTVPDHDALVRSLVDPDGLYGMPADAAADVVLTGGADAFADRLRAFGDAGADRVVVTVAAGDWFRQAELLAEARGLLDGPDRSGDGQVSVEELSPTSR